MFRAMITPIFRSTILCVTACGIMHPRCCQPVVWKRISSAVLFSRQGALYHKLYQTASSPKDVRDHRPKHVELIGNY